jgi:hypothetical protein
MTLRMMRRVRGQMRLCSEDREKRTLGISKEVTGQLKKHRETERL